ncbi:baseplate J/gp47 family protein [Romboutsia sp. 1001285H_161024_C4]|uniref:baseplate J/gp47 family protein n=1 Tax=Romboutsia sp. 1001285H_161024_C4 TaxID=2787109 RepID=UPI00189A0B0D|nr:baseplate J/gp47 family protein [Romboutsia sp. 1001285H_161024_C4]
MSNSYESIIKRTLNRIDSPLTKIEGSFTYNTIAGCSEEIAKAYLNMDDILKLGFIQDSFYDFLDTRVNEFGVYRKQGTKAIGELIVTGEDGTVISNGTILICNGLDYVVLNDIILPTDEKLFIESLEVGYKYKQNKGSRFYPLEEIDGLESLVADKDLTGGTDIETDEELVERFQKTVSNPSTSGNVHHYEQWALECEGIGKAKVYPLWDGNGTVKVMVTGNNNKPVDEELVTKCKEHIETEMPIGCRLTVTTPTLLNVTIITKVELNEGFTLEEIQEEFKLGLDDYLKTVDVELVYSKIYGILAKIQGVNDLTELKLNDNTINITISEDKIINISDIQISEVV